MWHSEIFHTVSHRIGLYHIPNPECGQGSEHTEDHRQPFPLGTQPLLYVHHRAAHHGLTLFALTVVTAQNHLGELGSHADQPRHEHPEDCPRPTDSDCRSHSSDIADTD